MSGSGLPLRRSPCPRTLRCGCHRNGPCPKAEQETRFEMAAVADLRSATARYPADTDLRSFVTDLRSLSPRFAELWDTHVVGIHESDHKIVHHPDVGTLTLDCDMLTVPGSDLRIITYSTAPDTDSADRLKLLSVIGTQTMWPSRSSR
ncbi:MULTISPECIES: MmyB family transcriptional regulator [unclassified Streptosporangium]|uniref:MmyB family transcriptional regulator n=1 Tax=unclassified Streptosporangium TaxID=2632669 RepID=UPI002E28B8B1|nr:MULTISPECIES: hypothetical protein [unclassified Streptosporangium]